MDREDLRHLNFISLRGARDCARSSPLAACYIQAEASTLRELQPVTDEQLQVVSGALSVDVCILRSGHDLRFWRELNKIDANNLRELASHAGKHLRALGANETDVAKAVSSFGTPSPFADVNMKILLRARRVAREDIPYATLKLDMADDVAELLTTWPDHRLIDLATHYPLPLSVLRGGKNTAIWKKILLLRKEHENAAKVLGHHLMMLDVGVQVARQ